MNVYIAGIYRSGSTWLFNAVRLLYLQNHSVSSGFIWWTLNEESEVRVIKTHYHYPDDELVYKPDLIVTSIRTREHIVQSMIKQKAKGLDTRFINAGNYREVSTFFQWLDKWTNDNRHVYQMDFNDLYSGNTIKILKELNKALKLKLTASQIKEVQSQLEALQPPKTGYDPVTLLTPTHIK